MAIRTKYMNVDMYNNMVLTDIRMGILICIFQPENIKITFDKKKQVMSALTEMQSFSRVYKETK